MAKLTDDSVATLERWLRARGEGEEPMPTGGLYLPCADALAELRQVRRVGIELRAEAQTLRVQVKYHRDRATKLQTIHAGQVVSGETETGTGASGPL